MTLLRDIDSCGGITISIGGPHKTREMTEQEIAQIIDALEYKKMFIEQFDRLGEANKLLIMETNDLRKQVESLKQQLSAALEALEKQAS